MSATEEMTYARALNEALRLEMEDDEDVLLLGEDIGIGGVFTVTAGLSQLFGEARVIDTPIAEAGFVGIATGAAIAGLRPVVELMFVEFALPAADQILNQAAKLRMMSSDAYSVPITIRTQQGIATGGGPQHSQSLESLFASVPGFAIALPSNPADAKGLLAAAIRMDEPTMVIEHKGLYFTKGMVPTGRHIVKFGSASIARRGTDVTIIAFSRAVHWALDAAEVLSSRHHISAEVLDLRTIVPLDMESVASSVSRTGAAVIVQESSGFCSISAEIAAQTSAICFDRLRSPVLRVAGLNLPVPYARSLEERWMPSIEDIVDAARSTSIRMRSR